MKQGSKGAAAASAAPAPPSTWLYWAALFAALAFIPDQKILRWKLLALEAGVAAALAVWLVRLALRPRQLQTRGPLDGAALAYAAGGILFYFLSPEPQNSELELVRVLFGAACYFAASRTVENPKPVLWAWSATAGLAGLYAVLQKMGSLGPFVFPQLERPFATFGNPIFLGVYLAASLVMTLIITKDSSALGTAFLAAALAAQTAGLWLTQSRAAWAAVLAVLSLWTLKRLDGQKRWLAFAALGGLALGLIHYARGREWTHGLIWMDAIRLWREHPLLGCGLGRFHLEFPAYASPALLARWPQGRVIVNFAHNEYIQVLAETGLIGLLAFVAAPLLLLKRYVSDAALAAEREGPALAALAVFAAALTSPDLRFGPSAFLAYAGAGLAAGAWTGTRPLAAATARVSALAGLALLCWGALLALRPALAVKKLAREAPFHATATPETRAELERLEAALKAAPGDADLAEALGYLYAKERAWEAALDRFALAARLDPRRPGPLNNLGNIHYSLGRYDEAARFWEASLMRDPAQKDARLNLAKLHSERGRLKEAARHLKEVLRRDPGDEKARIMLKKMVE